jgi:glyoxylase-like metal-dependent hydrolase (beta-lactamase superfamily II)
MPQHGAVRVDPLPLGIYQTNCAAVACGGHCWIVDAGFDPEPLIGLVERTGLAPEALVLTHAHLDHIAGVPQVRARWPGTPVLIHEAERDWLGDSRLNLSALAGLGAPISLPGPDGLLHQGQILTLGTSSWEVRHVPGHSPGSVALICHESAVVLGGDALFAGSIGRTDFPGSSFEQLARSIREQLYTLPDHFTVYPGHGEPTTIGREKRSNPFVPALV